MHNKIKLEQHFAVTSANMVVITSKFKISKKTGQSQTLQEGK